MAVGSPKARSEGLRWSVSRVSLGSWRPFKQKTQMAAAGRQNLRSGWQWSTKARFGGLNLCSETWTVSSGAAAVPRLSTALANHLNYFLDGNEASTGTIQKQVLEG